jgi:hypothetical protein
MRDLLSEIGIEAFHNVGGMHGVGGGVPAQLLSGKFQKIFYLKGRFSGSSETAPAVCRLPALQGRNAISSGVISYNFYFLQ